MYRSNGRRRNSPKFFVLVSIPVLVLFAAVYAATNNAAGWGVPVSMESIPGTSTEFNTQFSDGCPYQSPDGLSFYMASNRPGGLGGQDIWISRRAHVGDHWGPPENAGAPVNSAFNDFCPTPLDNATLYFVSDRPGGFGESDIYVSRFRNGAWETPENLGCSINSDRSEASPSVFIGEDGEPVLFFSSNRAGGFDLNDPPIPDSDIYFSKGFRPAKLVPGLNTPFDDSRPNVRRDGLEIVFDSNRLGTLGGPDLYTASRQNVAGNWGPVDHLIQLSSGAPDTRPSFSADGQTLVFGSARPGGEGQLDIFITTRRRVTPPIRP
ncbi:MAG TPA: hypothetical protein PKD26_15230 [Pyrinomonadaceae bacterium]|nr:hypothetical protein [Pyrinomonadaceae bacterium]